MKLYEFSRPLPDVVEGAQPERDAGDRFGQAPDRFVVKGRGAVIDVLAGNVSTMISNPTAVVPHIRTGKLKALGILGGQRIDVLKDVPTAVEQGYKEFADVIEWYGMVAPKATPRSIINQLNAGLTKVLMLPEVQERIRALGMAPSPNLFLSAVAQRTRRLRFGPMIFAAPLYHPLRLLEEIAMLDLISGGRIISGFVRGTGIEQLSTNANPAYNRERFEDVISASWDLVIIGWLVSVPIVVFGSSVVLKLVERFPIIITAGAGILGWVAGEMLVTDPSIVEWIKENMAWMHLHTPMGEVSWAQIVGVVIVIVVGKWLAARKESEDGAEGKSAG